MISSCDCAMSQAAECCMKNGYELVRHHLEPKDTTSPRAAAAAARLAASMYSGLMEAFGIRSSVPPKLPPPNSSFRSQNPDMSGTFIDAGDVAFCASASVPPAQMQNAMAAATPPRLASRSKRFILKKTPPTAPAHT